MTEPAADVICFGEILWDFLPDALYPGGAPFNVAYHLRQLGRHPRLVSAVGRDVLGDELLRRLRHWNIGVGGIARHAGRPTGTVRASLAAQGDARYAITTRVAWDRIALTAATRRAAGTARAFIFGSLAQRSPGNRGALARLLARAPAAAWVAFDVNLRPPYDDTGLVQALARRATLLKLNAAEAARLAAGAAERAGREEADARALAARTGCPTVCVTAGARGAGLLRSGRWLWEPGRPVAVADTVGAGDAFLAALVHNLLNGRIPDGEILARACRLGEWVASCRGATPAYGPSTPI